MIGMFEREGDVSTFPSYYAAPIALICGALALEGGEFAPAALLVSSIAGRAPATPARQQEREAMCNTTLVSLLDCTLQYGSAEGRVASALTADLGCGGRPA